MRYDGPHKIGEIKRFVIEIAQKVSKNNKPQSNTQAISNEVSKEEVHAYLLTLLEWSAVPSVRRHDARERSGDTISRDAYSQLWVGRVSR